MVIKPPVFEKASVNVTTYLTVILNVSSIWRYTLRKAFVEPSLSGSY